MTGINPDRDARHKRISDQPIVKTAAPRILPFRRLSRASFACCSGNSCISVLTGISSANFINSSPSFRVILEDDIRKRFTDEARDRPIVVFIEITAEEAVIRERLKRKRADSEADLKVYKMIRRQWDSLHGHHLILLFTDDNIEDMLQKAMDYISCIPGKKGDHD